MGGATRALPRVNSRLADSQQLLYTVAFT
jgi:hypothetical protein